MLFSDSNGRDILIYRSKLAIKYPSPFIFDKKNMDNARNSLTKELHKYYSSKKICHDDLEPVLLDKISNMSLKDLLKIIPTDDQITYCFSADTLDKLENFINPLTREPFSEKVVKRLETLEWGWRGLFDVGPLYGLYEDVPVRTLIPTTIGIPNMVRVKNTAKERELTGLNFLVEIIFEDETTTPLFEISLPTVGLDLIDDVRKYVDKLWNNGYFLSYWTSAVQNYLIDHKSYNVSITNEILLHAGDSIFDGNKAIELLRREYNK